MGKPGVIEFFCMLAEHNAGQNGTTADHLTIHERAWAYCPKDARLESHTWEPTGGVEATDIERFARGRDARHARDLRDAAAG